jgi:hypothetical protein
MPASLIKPTQETPFHIDFDWWRQNDQEWSSHLYSLLDEEQVDSLQGLKGDEQLDWVDPLTAEVTRLDLFQYLLVTQFANNETLLAEGTSMVESIFRVFLNNGNKPLSSEQLGEVLNRPPNTILKLLSSDRIYRGLRPVLAETQATL